jgi:transposase
VIHHRYRRDKISVISGVSVSPKRQRLGLFYQLYFQNIGQEEVCEFLRQLLRHLRRPVIALLDNSRTHHGEPLQDLLRRHSRLRIEHFPSHAPELNPDELVWSQLKRALGNSVPENTAHLRALITKQKRRLQRSQTHLRSCLHASDLPGY